MIRILFKVFFFKASAQFWNFPLNVLGDIDPEYNVVEVTDEAKEKLAKIDNKIGDFVCQLCKSRFDDAFGLAQHR